MNDIDSSLLQAGKFGVGQSVHRKEDPKLVRGNGRYTDDLHFDGELFAHVLRSPVAAGRVRAFDVEAARSAPGVAGIYTAFDFVAAGYGGPYCKLPLTNRDGTKLHGEVRPGFGDGTVRHVGTPLAVAVAATASEARDAAELIDVDIESTPAVTDMTAALARGAPLVSAAYPGNVGLDYAFGDEAAVDAAFADAAHVTTVRLVQNRLVVASLEPRAAIAEYDTAREQFTLHLGCQGAFNLRNTLAKDVLHVPPENLRVLTYDVGGSFGMKIGSYPEYVAILHAARALGRPVRWTDDRSDSFLSDDQGRDSQYEARLALDADGNFLAIKVDVLGSLGAYMTFVGPMIPSLNIRKNVPGPYKTPLLHVRSRSVLTHTVPVGPYRGAGRPEGVYVMERLIDAAARETGRDPIALRRQNLIAPGAMPFKAASDLAYDSGDFPQVFDRTLELADDGGYASRKAASEARGKCRGRAIAAYLEVTADSVPEMGAIHFEADGRITMVTGTSDYGQGHASTFAQILVDRLGLPFDRIDLVQKDSDRLIAGGGSGGSRSVMNSSMALLAAADEVEMRAKRWAAHVLEAPEADLVFDDGAFSIVGTDRKITLLDVAKRAREEAPTGDLSERAGVALAVVGGAGHHRDAAVGL
ncbi:MAG: xanthine dehydrogenase family protein, partial [Pseudomonadota bacterium]